MPPSPPLVSSAIGLIATGTIIFGFPILTKRRGWFWVRYPNLPTRILYIASLGIVWAVGDLGLLRQPAPLIATGVIVLAYFCAPNDDDDHRKPRRRLRGAWKRVTEYLARGLEPAHVH